MAEVPSPPSASDPDLDLGLVARLERFDPEPQRERVRRVIALMLLCLLAGTLVWIFVLVSLGAVDSATLSTLLTGIFTPLLTAAGVGTGFYFGSSSAGKGPLR